MNDGTLIAEIENLANEMKVSCSRDGGSYWLPAPGYKIDDWHGALVSLAEQARGRALVAHGEQARVEK